ncbi:MAG: chemotaxis protein CheX [Proteobacteria bacterium]|nr:chemotaxis protein CheX [Pseudomonadota bacterium]
MSAELNLDTLMKTTIETLEETAFIFTEPVDDAPPPWAEEKVFEARLEFSGDFSGTLMIAATSEPITELTANLLGTEPDDPDTLAKRSDAFGEILNIIGGVVVENWFGTAADIQLGIPMVRILTVGDYKGVFKEYGLSASLITEEDHRIDVAVKS